jgi:hypothetical protein
MTFFSLLLSAISAANQGWPPLRIMLGSRPQQTPIRFMRLFCCARAAIGDTTAVPPWKSDELAALHFTARNGNGCGLAQFGAEIARLAFNWDVRDVRSGSN